VSIARISAAAAAIAAVALAAPSPAIGSDPFPVDLAGHVVAIAPDGIGTTTIRTDLTPGDPTAANICRHAARQPATRGIVRVVDGQGQLLAGNLGGGCALP
jgi:hypothetical protein